MSDIKDKEIPLLPLRDVVIFPSVVTPLFVGRDKSIAALQAAMAGEKQIMLVAQKSAQEDDPDLKDLYGVGTLSTILQLIKLPDGTFNNIFISDESVGTYNIKIKIYMITHISLFFLHKKFLLPNKQIYPQDQ